MNQMYSDMRGAEWRHAENMLTVENEAIVTADKASDNHDQFEDALNNLENSIGLPGIEIGVKTLVLALSAAGLVPVTACRWHPEGRNMFQAPSPVVYFWTPAHSAYIIRDLVKDNPRMIITEANIDYVTGVGIYCQSIMVMLELAQIILDNRMLFDTDLRKPRGLQVMEEDVAAFLSKMDEMKKDFGSNGVAYNGTISIESDNDDTKSFCAVVKIQDNKDAKIVVHQSTVDTDTTWMNDILNGECNDDQ